MSQPFSVHVDSSGAPATVVVAGEIDIATIAELEAARTEALGGSPAALRIDLSEVTFVDSTGLRFLIETHRMTDRSGCELSLVRPAESAMHAFRLTGTDLRLPFIA
jgi:anti-anti-sigma factor